MLLAILEHLCYILPVYDEQGNVEKLTAGTVAAGYQNFLICIEMFFAAVALKYAFPISVYIGEGAINAEGRSVTMQSISSSLKVNVVAFGKNKWLRVINLTDPQFYVNQGLLYRYFRKQ